MSDYHPLDSTYREEDHVEATLRPRKLEEFVGQRKLKENLRIFVTAARERGDALDHVFLSGPPGLGKTTLANIMAQEMGTELRVTAAPALDKPKDLAGILTTLSERSVFFIDEVHRLKPALEEMLYVAMEDFEIDWVIGSGPSARTLRVPLPQFTLVGATTRPGSVAAPLLTRFGITARLDFYDLADLAEIIRRSAMILECPVKEQAVEMMARGCRGTPRVANRLLRRMRDFSQVLQNGVITEDVVRQGMERLNIDANGLDEQDRKILRTIINVYGGGPVGAETLAISVGEEIETLEVFYEPYLIQQGYIQRTARGRMVTTRTYGLFGMQPPEGQTTSNPGNGNTKDENQQRNEDQRSLF